MKSFSLSFRTGILLLLLPALALAHPGHEQTTNFMQGVLHPLFGMDHLLAMILVGILAVQLSGRALWSLPLIFVVAMAVGSLAGFSGIRPSLVEIGIALSVVLLGALLAMKVQLPLVAALVVTGLLALFHGHAHGAEAPGGELSLAYLVGFLLGTSGLHLLGILAGLGMARAGQHRGEWLSRGVGLATTGVGVLLLTAL